MNPNPTSETVVVNGVKCEFGHIHLGWYIFSTGALTHYLRSNGEWHSANDGSFWPTEAEARAFALSRSQAEGQGGGWTQEPPREQGTYWHWNGDEDSAPLPMFVLYSGFSDKCFVSMGQLGITQAIDCDEYGGWWMPLETPLTPKEIERASWKPIELPAPPAESEG